MPSAVIKSYSYDADRQILEIIYLNVPEKVFAAMRSTMVKGI